MTTISTPLLTLNNGGPEPDAITLEAFGREIPGAVVLTLIALLVTGLAARRVRVARRHPPTQAIGSISSPEKPLARRRP